jgi:hypothetical protein
MSKIKYIIASLFMLVFGVTSVLSQDVKLLERELSKAGFEQIIVLPVGIVEQEMQYKLGLEHRGINNPLDIILLANLIGKKLGFNHVTYTIFLKGQVLFESSVDQNRINSNILSDTYTRDFNRSFSINKYRFNTYLTPEIKVRFGNFENPLQSKIDVILGTDLILFRGFSLFSGISIPVSNDLDNREKSITLAPTFLEYFSQLLPGHFIQISTGLFFNNRYGLDSHYKYLHPKHNWSVGFRYAQTGFYYFPSSSIYIDPIADQLVLFDFEYFFPKQRISTLVQVGQYLDSDKGMRVELNKQYRNVEVGFFSSVTESGNNSGFKFMLPLFPRKIIRTNSFELRTDEAFRWEYAYSNESTSAGNFNTGNSLSEKLRRFNSNFFNNY